MPKMKVFRTDARNFKLGSTMSSYGDHRDRLPDEYKKKAEDAIRRAHPDGEAIRRDSLYTYEDRSIAERDYHGTRLKQPKRHLYELEIDDEDIVHTGNLDIYDDVIKDIHQKNDPTINANRYWEERPTNVRSTEILLKKATVLAVILDAKDWKSADQRAIEKLRNEADNQKYYENPTLTEDEK